MHFEVRTQRRTFDEGVVSEDGCLVVDDVSVARFQGPKERGAVDRGVDSVIDYDYDLLP